MKGNILIVEDNKSILTALEMLLSMHFKEVKGISSPKSLMSELQGANYQVVLLDMNFKAGQNTGNEGIYWLSQIKAEHPELSVVMITAHGDVELAVKAVKQGAFDFILKPWDNNKLLATLHSAIEFHKSRKENKTLKAENKTLKENFNTPASDIIGQSARMKKLMYMVSKVADTEANILICGENGTGKELIAREIHRLSKRKNQLLVNVDMGSISESLFESELFGHVKGAFTDAREDRTGKIEMAHKGTLFLDEIGNLSPAMQQKLLVSLQNRTVTKVGSNKATTVDIRLISATNNNLLQKVEQHEFREDLLYRINTISIEVPPLRARDNDVLLLAGFYLEKYCKKYQKPRLTLSSKAEKALLEYHWPGNVRELQHAMEKAVILSDENELQVSDFSFDARIGQQPELKDKTLEEVEQLMIERALDEHLGNMSLAAKKLGITRQTLYNKIKKFAL